MFCLSVVVGICFFQRGLRRATSTGQHDDVALELEISRSLLCCQADQWFMPLGLIFSLFVTLQVLGNGNMHHKSRNSKEFASWDALRHLRDKKHEHLRSRSIYVFIVLGDDRALSSFFELP
jgi:hypothetical protein